MKEFDARFLRTLSALSFAVARMRAKEQGGARRSDRRGGRTEFADHRPYTPGDDFRDVDWPAHARTGRLYVKEYERRDDTDVEIVVDGSASMGLHGKFATAARIAWALAWVAVAGRSHGAGSDGGGVRVSLCADGRISASPRIRAREAIGAITSFLSDARAGGETRLVSSLSGLPAARRGTRVVVLISDLLSEDDGRRALAACADRGDAVSVLHLVAAEDWAPPEDAAVLVDAETGERVTPGAATASIAARRAAASEEEWRAFAARRRIRYVRADAAASAEDTVLSALRDGGVLA